MKVIDKSAFLDTFQYFDKPIVIEIIDIFINEQPERMEKIEKAIKNKDFTALKFDAHSLKGVIANFVAEEPHQIAKQLEMKGAEQDDSDLEELFASLQTATEALLDDLKELRPDFEE
ncbi:MAG: Hpt domain-containing protein [Bacteroidetes bacterium]|nr:Hpt domain-containing protein [Bacteroidota bacterium]MBU1577883.1 Hpt domain-containing protein [Bacteroidota bacterium]MBU2465349.1 Hpt domain-containing protein [Bacteroidota bacterium]MBU2556842.1 Hpt domain-containing protein [Bacteroidota bacterium]